MTLEKCIYLREIVIVCLKLLSMVRAICAFLKLFSDRPLNVYHQQFVSVKTEHLSTLVVQT